MAAASSSQAIKVILNDSPLSFLLNSTDPIIGTRNGNIHKISLKASSIIHSIGTSLESIEYLCQHTNTTSFWACGRAIHLYSEDFNHEKTLSNHEDVVISLFSTASFLLSASEDCTVRIWQHKDYTPSTLYSHEASVIAFYFNSNLQVCASACTDNWLILFDVNKRQEKRKLNLEEKIWSIIILNNRKVVTGDHSGSLKIYGEGLFPEKNLSLHESRIKSLSLAARQDVLVSGGFDAKICVVGIEKFEKLKDIQGHDDWIRAVGFDRLGKLCSISDDKRFVVWDYESQPLVNNWQNKVMIGIVAGVIFILVIFLSLRKSH